MSRNSEHSLTGKLLLAMPGLGDPRFYRAVIFMCAHDEKGAMGLVINHTLPGIEFSGLMDQLKISSDIKINIKKFNTPVMCGGPEEKWDLAVQKLGVEPGRLSSEAGRA